MERSIEHLTYSRPLFSESKLKELLQIFKNESIGFTSADQSILFKIYPKCMLPRITDSKYESQYSGLKAVFFTDLENTFLRFLLEKTKYSHQTVIIQSVNSQLENDTLLEFPKPEIPLTNDLFVRENGWIKKIKLKEILFFHLEGSYANLQCEFRSYTLRTTTKALLEKLKNKCFIQVSKSYLINLNFITRLSQKMIIIKDYQIPLGKKYRSCLLQKLNII